MKKIISEKAYNKALADVYNLMKKGEKNITKKEANNITTIAKAIQGYENIHYPFPIPKTITEMVELKMFEKKINRGNLAKILGMDAPKISQILNKKREPDVTFLKAIHDKLEIDGNFILKCI
jgi:HTH-type transcriptional regulator / antitoxin HigA